MKELRYTEHPPFEPYGGMRPDDDSLPFIADVPREKLTPFPDAVNWQQNSQGKSQEMIKRTFWETQRRLTQSRFDRQEQMINLMHTAKPNMFIFGVDNE